MLNGVRRVAIVFSGGPAPGANAVIAAAAFSFLEAGAEVLGIFHGYTNLQEYDPVNRPMVESKHYRLLTAADIRGVRNTRGIIIGTARVNPGAMIEVPSDLLDPEKTERLARIHHALADLRVDALISIGGDDTLKTANFLYEYQRHHVSPRNRVRIVHLPKTIDNDYRGIDFTFGFFTAVDVMAKELLNLRADCIATSSYFIVETMGRKAGWLSYGVAIAGEASMVLSTEDVYGDLAIEEKSYNPITGEDTAFDHGAGRPYRRHDAGAREARSVLRHGGTRRRPRRDAAREFTGRDASRRAWSHSSERVRPREDGV